MPIKPDLPSTATYRSVCGAMTNAYAQVGCVHLKRGGCSGVGQARGEAARLRRPRALKTSRPRNSPPAHVPRSRGSPRGSRPAGVGEGAPPTGLALNVPLRTLEATSGQDRDGRSRDLGRGEVGERSRQTRDRIGPRSPDGGTADNGDIEPGADSEFRAAADIGD